MAGFVAAAGDFEELAPAHHLHLVEPTAEEDGVDAPIIELRGAVPVPREHSTIYAW